jgi:2-polyprenyl-3-methyl-5-hydroxy-6-metoxy-1,4-benzoquinol methylase
VETLRTHQEIVNSTQVYSRAMSAHPPPSPWTLLAAGWEELFPLRQPRLDLALGLTAAGDQCLDAGCATGSLPRALAARGRVAHGLDLDPAFLAVARRRSLEEGLAVTWHEASLLDLAEAAGGARFKLITCLGQTLPHLLEEAEWLAFFAQVREALEPGGRLVIQAVHDGARAVGESRDLPAGHCAGGTLERRRTMVSADLACFETVFRPASGEPVASRIMHRRMAPARAADLLREAGLGPAAPSADEAGKPFEASSPGWVLIARRDAS